MNSLSVILIVTVALLLIVFAIYATNPKESKKKKKTQSIREQGNDALSTLFFNVPVFKPISNHIFRYFKSICPYDKPALRYNAKQVLRKTLAFSFMGTAVIVAMSIILRGQMTLYAYASIGLLFYIVYHEVLLGQVESRHNLMYTDFARYLVSVKHLYRLTLSIPESVLQASEGLCYEIKATANQLYKILSSADRENLVKEYMMSPYSSRYIKLFLSQCYEASENGDQEKTDGSSVFADNIETLRVEVIKDTMYSTKKTWRYKGHTAIIVLPVFTMDLFRKWGADFAPAMTSFFDTTGHIVVAATFAVTILIYRIFTRMRSFYSNTQHTRALPYGKSIRKIADHVRNNKSNKLFAKITKILDTCNQSSLEDLLVKMCVSAGLILGFLLIFVSTMHSVNKQSIIRNIDVESISVVGTAKQKEAMAEVITQMLDEHKNDKEIRQKIYETEFQQKFKSQNKSTAEAVGQLICQKLQAYQSEYITWQEYVFILLASAIAAIIPIVELIYSYKALLDNKQNETHQFQAIIAMEYRFVNITVVKILESLENFSSTYKLSLRKCLNNMSTGVNASLDALRFAEIDNPEFVEIVDGLKVAENIGVLQAFTEIENNRLLSSQSREIDQEINFTSTANKIDIIALLPMILVVGGYFIVPFLFTSLGSITDMYDALTIMQQFT